jgi:hypothetical protein
MECSLAIRKELDRCYLGVAFVYLDSFVVEDSSTHGFRPYSHANLTKLAQTFDLVGCKPHLYPVDALINEATRHTLIPGPPATAAVALPRLPREARALCLHGKHRLQLGARYLGKDEAYWITTLYRDGSFTNDGRSYP